MVPELEGQVMAAITQDFRAWVFGQRPCGAEAEQTKDGYRFVSELAVAEVNLYPYINSIDIVELRITRALDGESTFFLHFMLDDLDRAQELFGEMAVALEDMAAHERTRVLLCCSSALTTSYFASKMTEVAQTLALDYEFSAMSMQRALDAPDDYAAILLAPQVRHMRREVARSHPHALVFEIPAKLFGAYDAAGAIRLLMHALHEGETMDEAESLRPLRGVSADYRVLVITLFSLRNGALLGYRLYRGTEVLDRGAARKETFDFRDIEDLIETMGMRGVELSELDAIGIAVPGVTFQGLVSLPNILKGSYDLGPHLASRFGLPVFVDNNCNAAAVACYMSQDDCEKVAFFRQEFGHAFGGFGTVIDGRLVRGFFGQAGEPKYIEARFDYGELGGYDEARFSADGLLQIAVNMCLTSMAMTAPQVIYLSVDTVDDLQALHDALAEVVGHEFVPILELVDDYVGLVFLGEMVLCTQHLREASPASLQQH